MTRIAAMFALIAALTAAPQQPSGTAVIEGVVVDDARRPVARALVDLSGPATRSAITSDDGRFSVEGLVPGQYSLIAAKARYAPTPFGRRRADGKGTSIVLAAGEHFRATVEMPRAAALSGTIRAADGQPWAGVGVTASRIGEAPVYRPVVRSDNGGRYRVSGLEAGDYVVSASIPGSEYSGELERTVNGVTQLVMLSSAYYPSVFERADAQKVSLTAGDDVGGVDITIAPVEVTRVHVTARASDNAVIPAQVGLGRRGVDGFADRADVHWIDLKDGEATLTGIAAGLYTLFAKSRPLLGRMAGAPHGPEWARSDVSVDGRTPIAIALTMEPMTTMSGSVAFDGPAPNPISAYLSAGTSTPGTVISFNNWTQADRQGHFMFPGLPPGSYSFNVDSPNGWSVQSVIVAGRDALDVPFSIIDSTPINDVVATYTKKSTVISGTLVDGTGRPSFAAAVVLVADDPKYWTTTCRRVRIGEPDSNGHFEITGAPSGAYRIAADASLRPGDCADGTRLELIRSRGTLVTLVADQKISLEVRLPGSR